LRNILRRTGTYHLLAISGVHIGSALVIPLILFKALLSFLGKDGVGWRKVAPMTAGSVTLFVYLSLAGLSTSALRAGMFFVLYWAAAIAGRYPHPFSVLGWCVTLIVCLVPGDQPDMALYLSAAAVTGILVTGTHQCRHGLKILRVTMGAILFTLPLSVWCAGGISTVAPVCNLFAGLVFGLILIPLAVLIDLMACVVSHPWELPVDVWIGLAGPLIVALKWFSDPSSAFLVLSEAGCLVATAAGLISLVIWKGSAFSLRAGIALFLAVMLVAMGFEKTRDQFLNKETVLYFPRVGQADAAVLKGGGKTVIIDCAASGRPGQMTVLERRLVKMGVKRINALFLSHAHPDHAGGIRDLAGRWNIDVLYLPEFDRYPGRWSEVMEWVSKVTKIVSLKEEDELNIGPFSILVLGPPLENWERAGENARSLQLYVKWGDRTAFFAGDAPWEQVLPSLEKIPRLELIKIPHHGSRVGFPPDGLRSEVSRFCRKGVLTAVFPSPPPGTSSLPSGEVVNWFEKQGARCLFTGQGEGLTFGTGEIARTGIF
jgi:competence protein ComEC